MPGKMARSASRPPFGLPDALVAVCTSRQSCRKAGKARIFAPVWESSGESRPKCLRIGLILIIVLVLLLFGGLGGGYIGTGYGYGFGHGGIGIIGI